MSAREEVLRRVRTALRDVPTTEGPDDVPVPRDYLRTHAEGDLVELFAERVADYRATVVRVSPGADSGTGSPVAAAVADALRALAPGTVVVPDGFPPEWLPADAPPDGWLRDDPPLATDALDRVGAVLTTAALGIALTGTLVLDAGPGQGRRALTLLPDVHICVVRAGQIAADVPDGLVRLDSLRPLTFVSGPSATSDIELQRVEGVHGPRTLYVIVVEEAATL
jgi:L-lactate dehydrogenase complex protein LldG